ncbi:beta-barrel assembly complex subunit BamF [Litoreibacter ponti]|uniref:Beta-barrel assembly complex subunit BamF n=1 Tax=Litoreibacter ponti TaxID=1510457 RepID=A0A2T6BNN5_9RHOB|nr:DUF3035 domain-containing protein [Litoreibacter ponti]PTX57656.1 beta-barrel assembly complex subunit BamF [Litoreibacter ponti]
MPRHAMILAGICAAMVLSACDRNAEPSLLNIKSQQVGPDEFSILPNKPLTLPDDYSALPAPTRGGSNRVDPTPLADATVALGGNPAGGIRDGGLVNYASRYGVTPNIRTALAEEDLEYRRDNDGRILERLFNVNVYFEAYAEQSLDQYRELERMRRLGVRTVSAPPESTED